jgi:NAD(P)-dependent dehydrogenase (short-subunit alcohol dehydrogenase family)
VTPPHSTGFFNVLPDQTRGFRMKIADSVALVTGANRGIGASLARELADRGAGRVYAAARQPAALPQAAPRHRGVMVPLALDVTDPSQVRAAAAAAPDVTLLVNNAGTLAPGGVLDADLDGIEREMAVNFFGVLRMARAFAPMIEANGGGAVVNMISVLAPAPYPASAGYCATKAAADSATRALRAELAPRGITVHGVYPSFVDTDMTARVDAEKASPADVAKAVADALEQGINDVTPDPVSAALWQAWLAGPRDLDQLFAAGP